MTVSSEAPMLRIAIAYESFGPYHLARLEALAEQCKLLAIEYVRKSATYDWEPAGEFNFDGFTLAEDVSGLEKSGTNERLENVLSAFAPSVVFVPGWAAPQALAMLRWCRNARVPAVVMSDSQEIDEPRIWAKELLKGQLLGLFDGALVAGTRHRAYLDKLGFGRRPVKAYYDVVDNSHFAPSAGESARRTILCVARLVEKKNLPMLLEAYHLFVDCLDAEGVSAPELVILGEGPLHSDLTSQVAKLKLDNKVCLRGFVDYPDLPYAYQRARIFVLPSTTEQWGLVVNEAMAAGCPVLVSERAGCVPELVLDGRNGFSFNPDDPVQLANQLLWLHRNPNTLEKFGNESRQIIGVHGLTEHVGAVLDVASDTIADARQRASWLRRFLLWSLLKIAQCRPRR